MIREIGIMQGRLSPPRARLQSFPHETWEAEFARAGELGFDTIEWVFEAEAQEANPIVSFEGRSRIREQILSTGVRVATLCANYFMTHPFFRVAKGEQESSVNMLETLVDHAAEIGVETLLIPVLESSAIATDKDKAMLLDHLRAPLARASARSLKLALESDLPASEIGDLVDRTGELNLGVYYDCGNATANGHDAAAELSELGARVSGIHIKDRPCGGGNVPLGTGGVDFTDFFGILATSPYLGPLVLETTPGDDPEGFAKRHLAFVREHLSRLIR